MTSHAVISQEEVLKAFSLGILHLKRLKSLHHISKK